MGCQIIRFSALITCPLFVAGVCHTEISAAQGQDGPAIGQALKQAKRDVENVEGEQLESEKSVSELIFQVSKMSSDTDLCYQVLTPICVITKIGVRTGKIGELEKSVSELIFQVSKMSSDTDLWAKIGVRTGKIGVRTHFSGIKNEF